MIGIDGHALHWHVPASRATPPIQSLSRSSSITFLPANAKQKQENLRPPARMVILNVLWRWLPQQPVLLHFVVQRHPADPQFLG